MNQYFHLGYNETLGIERWNIESVGAMVGACATSFLLGALQPALSRLSLFLRWKLIRDPLSRSRSTLTLQNRGSNSNTADEFVAVSPSSPCAVPMTHLNKTENIEIPTIAYNSGYEGDQRHEGDPGSVSEVTRRDNLPSASLQIDKEPSLICSSSRLILACFHTLHVTLTYCLMVLFMTFNLWLCLSVALGIGLGYFLFNKSQQH